MNRAFTVTAGTCFCLRSQSPTLQPHSRWPSCSKRFPLNLVRVCSGSKEYVLIHTAVWSHGLIVCDCLWLMRSELSENIGPHFTHLRRNPAWRSSVTLSLFLGPSCSLSFSCPALHIKTLPPIYSLSTPNTHTHRLSQRCTEVIIHRARPRLPVEASLSHRENPKQVEKENVKVSYRFSNTSYLMWFD